MPCEYDAIFQEKASDFGLDWKLLKAIGKVESNWNASAVGLAGEIGMMQIMLSTGLMLGYNILELWSPDVNVECAAKYLSQLSDRYGGNTEDMISAYNQGSPRRNEDGTYKNQSYVDKVLGWYRSF